MRRRTWIGVGMVIAVTVLLVLVLWPPPDPLAGVTTVAIQPPDWEGRDPTLRAPFLDGLSVTLGTKDVRLVADPTAADAVLAVQDVRVDSVVLRLDSGVLTGRLSATCLLTDRRTGRTQAMDFRLELRDGTVRATLTPRRWWQLSQRG